MATGTGQQLADEQAWVEAQGFSLTSLDQDRAREDWYRPDGLRIPNLPVDGYHRETYRKKGWTLQPPTAGQVDAWNRAHPKVSVGVGEIPVLPLPPELMKELAEVTGTELPLPPKHIHVYASDQIGTPCLVLGCPKARQALKVPWNEKKPRASRKPTRTRTAKAQKPEEVTDGRDA